MLLFLEKSCFQVFATLGEDLGEFRIDRKKFTVKIGSKTLTVNGHGTVDKHVDARKPPIELRPRTRW